METYTLFVLLLTFSVSPLAVAYADQPIALTLHIYSGTGDPYWLFYGTPKFDPFWPQYSELNAIMSNTSSTPLSSNLGYRGFTLQSFYDGGKSFKMTVGRCSQPALEANLVTMVKGRYSTASGILSNNTVVYVESEIKKC